MRKALVAIFLTAFAGIAQAAEPARMLDRANERLAAAGAGFRVAMAEYITAPGSGEFGATVFAKDVGNKQLLFHFAPELVLFPPYIVYAVDTGEGAASGGLSSADTEAAIDRAMATWDSQSCTGLPIGKLAVPGVPLGAIQWIFGFGPEPPFFPDVAHAGWLGAEFFDAISPPDGSQYILGVTFTFMWVDEDGNPVDTNGDHRYDAAFREIYYNDAFQWTNLPVTWQSELVDVETIALHEAGHGLSQAHFGQVFFDGSGVRSIDHLHFSPRAVMNAIYWETQRSLLGSDLAGHCSIWGNWPL